MVGEEVLQPVRGQPLKAVESTTALEDDCHLTQVRLEQEEKASYPTDCRDPGRSTLYSPLQRSKELAPMTEMGLGRDRRSILEHPKKA